MGFADEIGRLSQPPRGVLVNMARIAQEEGKTSQIAAIRDQKFEEGVVPGVVVLVDFLDQVGRGSFAEMLKRNLGHTGQVVRAAASRRDGEYWRHWNAVKPVAEHCIRPARRRLGVLRPR